MGSIRLLLGKTRRRRRAAIPTELLQRTDLCGHPTHLHLTHSWRRRREIERSLTGKDRFTPSVRVFGELIRTLWDRFGDGRVVLTREAIELAADAVVSSDRSRWPWLSATGPSEGVGADLAGLLLSLQESDRTEVSGTGHDRELNSALRAVHAHLNQRGGFTTEPTALTALRKRLSTPSPALQRWLVRAHSVVVDDLLHPSPLRTEVLVALCRAWANAGTHVILTLETGRDLGGREAGYFFEYEDIDGYSLKAFDATRTLRQRLFDTWIASGEASIHVAGAQGVVEVEPWSPAQAAEPPDLSDRLYAAEPVPAASVAEARALLGAIRIRRAIDPDAEISAIADEVHAAILGGQAPGGCVVALPDLDQRADQIRHAFEARQIPYTIASGTPLMRTPAAKALLRIASVALAGFPVRELLQLFDQLATPLPIPPMKLLEWCRAAGVRDGPPETWWPALVSWARRARHRDQLTAIRSTLDAMMVPCAMLEGFCEPAAPRAWHARLLQAADRLGLCAQVEGADDVLKAWAALLQTVEQLVLDLSTASNAPWPADRLAIHLERAITRSSWYPQPPSDQRVALVGVRELQGLTPARVWLGGLARGVFPRPMPPSGILPGDVQRSLDPVDPLKEARYLFCSLLRNALGDPQMRSVCLSWPTTRDGRHLAPSPLLADLLTLPTTHGSILGDLVVEDLGVRDPRLATDPEWDRAQRIRHDARREGGPSAFLGFLERPPVLPPTISVTAFESYLRCPARYAYDRLLGLQIEDAWTEELEPRRRGTALHRILEAFFVRRHLAPLHGEADRDRAARMLHEVASTVLDEVESEGGFEPIMQAYARTRWLAGLVDTAPAGLLRAWLDSEIDAPRPSLPLAVELPFSDLQVGPARLRGAIDRVDKIGSTLAITDYKTGAPPAERLVRAGLSFQPVAYAAALAERHPGCPVTAGFLSLKRPDALRRTTDIDLSDDARRPLMATAAAAAHAMGAGHFPTTSHGPTDAGCTWCPHRRICRADHTGAGDTP